MHTSINHAPVGGLLIKVNMSQEVSDDTGHDTLPHSYVGICGQQLEDAMIFSLSLLHRVKSHSLLSPEAASIVF